MSADDPQAALVRPGPEIALQVAEQYGFVAPIEVRRLVSGHINESFEVRAGAGHMLLQWINPHVFPHTREVQDNVERVLDHLAASAPEAGYPHLLTSVAGARRIERADGLWRALEWLDGSETLTRPDGDARAHRAGLAVGAFDGAVAGLAPAALHDVLAGFHDLGARLATLDAVRARAAPAALAAASAELARVDAQRATRHAAMSAGERRVIHGDPKFTNLLFRADRAVLVDYDTVMPGLLAWDFGDFLRSAAARGDEDDPLQAAVRTDRLLAAAGGFLDGLRRTPAAPPAMSAAEAAALATAPAGMAFMLAVRFLADHLDGDRYFRIRRPGQNLDRARTQLALAEAFDGETERLAALVDAAVRP